MSWFYFILCNSIRISLHGQFLGVGKILKSDYWLRPFCLLTNLSARLQETVRLQLDVFLLHLMSEYFSKVCQENSSFITI
jgi:hypothetical protein